MMRLLRAGLGGRLTTAGLCLAVAITVQAQGPSLEDQRIVAIRVVTEAGTILKENPALLSLQPGQTYSSEAVRESLRQLYRSGDFADIRAEAAPSPGGLRLDFVVQQNLFINVVRVLGLHAPPNEQRALSSLRLGLGEPYHESTLREALDRLGQTLQDEGFYRAKAERELTPHPETRQMDIAVLVTLGRRALIGTMGIRNLTEFPDQELLSRSKLKPRQQVTSAHLDRAAERLRRFLAAQGHLGTRVGVRRGAYDPRANTLPVVFDVSAGPKVRVEVAGAKIPSNQPNKLLPIYQDGKPGYRVIRYEVQRGPHRRLVGVAFEGNKYFGDELLSSRLHIQPAAFLSRGRFSHRLLQEDETSIGDLYVANGFREAQVKGELIEDYGGKEGDLFVRFNITEGPQTRVAELKLEGNRALSDGDLLSVIGSTRGQPYSEFNVSSDRDNVLALYYNEGFPEARFESEVSPAGELNGVRPTYRMAEGRQVSVERVLLSGYKHTRRGVIARQVQIQPGGPLRESDVVETQRRLYNLGIFSRVSIAPQNPAGTDPNKPVDVLVEEAKRYTLGYGFGFEAQRLGGAGTSPVGGKVRASPRGIFEITKANVGGRAHTVSFKVRASSFQGRGLLSYTAPNFFARPEFSLLLTGLADKTSDVRT